MSDYDEYSNKRGGGFKGNLSDLKTIKINIDKVMIDIRAGEMKAINAAGDYVREKIKDKVLQMFGNTGHGSSGNLYKGMVKKAIPDGVLVGAGSPAFHAHLLEFGTVERHTQTGKFTGSLKARPFILPTFEEQKNKVIEIIAEKQWV